MGRRHGVLKTGISTVLSLGLLAAGMRGGDQSGEAVRGRITPLEANGLPGISARGLEIFGHVAVQPCTSKPAPLGPCDSPSREKTPTISEPTTSTVTVPKSPATTEQTTTSSLPRPANSIPNTIPPPPPSDKGSYLGTFEATCYALSGITASGQSVGPGSVAVDPRVIPMGMTLQIEGYGHGVAADTGSAIVGHRIDVWKPTDAECIAWGRQQVDVWATG